MPEKAKAPAIRFKGFNDAWEQRKLGEVGSTYTGLSGKSKMDFGHGEGRYVTYMNVFTNAISSPKMVEPIEIDAKQNEVKAGDVFFTTSSETPEEVGMSSVMLENRPNTYLNSFCFGYRPIEKFDNYYLAYMLRSDCVRENIVFLAQGISRYNISKNKVMEIEVPIPQMAEQWLLGDFFCNLDNLITLHQRKLMKLKNVKKAMLEKMFPKNGSNVPEIRFAGFTDGWEQRKLGELVQFSKGTGYSKADLRDKGTPIILYGRLYTKYETVISEIDTFADKKPASVYSRGGEVIVPASGETAEDISIASVVDKPGVLLGGDLNIITPPDDLDSAFLAISISSGKPHNDMAKMAQGKSVVHLHNSDLEKIDLLYANYSEQVQISNFFTNLDNLITLHQRKYKKLQNLKKACLEKMFV
jgi:type I restriction enzyme S subunit